SQGTWLRRDFARYRSTRARAGPAVPPRSDDHAEVRVPGDLAEVAPKLNETQLTSRSFRLATVYVTHPRYVEHDLADHREHADRTRAAWSGLADSGVAGRMQQFEAEPVRTDLLLTVHTPGYLASLERISALPGMTLLDADTYAGPNAMTIASLSA